MTKVVFEMGDVVPKDVLRPEPDDGAWSIRFGQTVLVTRTKRGARVEIPPGVWPTTAPLCVVKRAGRKKCSGKVVLNGAPTVWVVPPEVTDFYFDVAGGEDE